MGVSKTDSCTKEKNRIASLTKSIGHPARMAILDYLLKVDSFICGDIVNELPISFLFKDKSLIKVNTGLPLPFMVEIRNVN
jgi:hypothetical protein